MKEFIVSGGYQCPICRGWLSSQEDLRRHMERCPPSVHGA